MISGGGGDKNWAGISVPESFGSLPGCLRLLLGLDGTLTRSLTFLSGSPVTVEPVRLPDSMAEIRKVFLSVPGHGRLVFARTRLLPSSETKSDPWIDELLRGGEAIGQSMETRYGPLLKDEFAVFSVSGVFDSECTWEGGVTWARSYRMRTSGGIGLRIEEFFLPALGRLLARE